MSKFIVGLVTVPLVMGIILFIWMLLHKLYV